MVWLHACPDRHDVVVRRAADVNRAIAAGNRIPGWMNANNAHGKPCRNALKCSMASRHADPVSMPIIDIRHPHSIGKPGCRAAIDAVAGDLSRRYGLDDMSWDGDTLNFAGRGVQGSLTVGENDARATVRLGPMLGLLRPAIEAEIRRQLREHLG